jgi:hypothetical protein
MQLNTVKFPTCFFHPKQNYVQWFSGQDQDGSLISFFINTKTKQKASFKTHDDQDSIDKDIEILKNEGWTKLDPKVTINEIKD